MLIRMHTNTTSAGIYRLSRIHLYLLLSCFFLLVSSLVSSLVFAQSSADLRALIFDPVPISVSVQEAGAGLEASTLITELSGLPVLDAVGLQTWLDSNRTITQPEPDQSSQDITRYETSIIDLELAEGPFSAQLPQQLLALGVAYQKSGELDKALENFDRALHVTRINMGLFTTEQIPIIEQTIRNYLIRGDMQAADEQQRYLFYLQQKNFGTGSAELLPALNSFAQWNIFAFSAPSNYSLATDNITAANNSNDVVIRTADEAGFRIDRLINAQNIYWSIIQIVLKNFGPQDSRLPDFEKRLALTNYYFATSVAAQMDALYLSDIEIHPELASPNLIQPPMSDMGYRLGREALERRRNYMLEMPSVSMVELANAELDLADWMLIFNRQRTKVLDMYKEIHDSLDSDNSQPELNDIFEPSFPATLPSYITPLNSRAALGIPAEQALKYQGHIDVEFELNRYGRVTRAKVLGSSKDTSARIENILLRNVQRAQYRPRLNRGEIRDKDIIQTRFYYAY